MPIDPDCPDPMHRLFALVGGLERIRAECRAGAPSVAAAVAGLLLREHEPADQRAAVALMVEAGQVSPEQIDRAGFFLRFVLRSGTPSTSEGTPARARRRLGPRRRPAARRRRRR